MAALTTDEIDRELDSRTKEVAAAVATLMELDSHQGLEHVRRYPPTGVTAQRWVVIERALGELWEDVGRMTTILDSAKALRGRRSKPDDDDRVELTRLLRERPLEVSRERIPLAQRVITAPGESVGYVGLGDVADDMRAAYPAVAEFLDGVEKINSLVVARLGPLQKRLDAAGATGPKQMAELLTVSATDPLSLTTSDVEERVRTIVADVDRRSTELAELAELQSNWADAIAVTVGQLDTLRAAVASAADVRVRVEQTVLAGPLPSHEDAEPGLRAQLDSITTPDPAALRDLRRRIEAALRVAREDEELAQGLLDRRTELKGRLTAYQAKAARLELGEDRDLLASSRIASGLLHRQPCDLRAVTRAVAHYRQLLVEKQEGAR
ncbi:MULTISPECIES: hypothetical protein [unclassified Mycobacterium]|uniref:hypothetical protein n=1 Tax=unclassified Mycobacterium TaxID=2642494 RepID=UPI0029C65484|nr:MULTISPECIES: hypothetical protein [unclassified Mycobacterium]